MKKLLAILMCAMLLFTLAACGGGDNNGDGNDSGINANNGGALSENLGDSSDTNEEPVKISRGTITGDAYANEFLGITFTKPSEWNYLSDAEIADTINIGQDALDFGDIEKALAEKATVYDMAAMDNLYGNSVMVCYENTLVSGGSEISADDYADILRTNLENQTALDYTFESEGKAFLGNTEFVRCVFSAETNGVTLKQAYYVKTMGKYAVTVITTMTNTDIAAIEAMFS